MDPELINEIEADHQKNHQRIKAQERQPEPEQEFMQPRADTLAQGGTQVEPDRRMMGYMSGPKYANLVIGTMKPIVGKVIQEEERDPGPPLPANKIPQRTDLMQRIECHKSENLR